MNNKIYSLQYLRAFAALWVLLTHVLQRLEIHPGGVAFAGQWGVDIFFLLSGFIIYLTTKDYSSWKAFAIKRVFRIYPAYLLQLIVYCLYSVTYNGTGYGLVSIVQNILMIPFSGPIGFKSLIVGQAWSTCYEMYFYALLTILLLFDVSKKRLLPVILVLFVIGFGLNRIFPMKGFVGYLYSLIGARHIFFFCEGIIIALLNDKIQNIKIDRTVLKIVSVLAFFAYVAVLCTSYRFYFSLLISPLMFCIVYKANEVLAGKGLVHRVMLALGDASFSIYLIHSVVIRFLFNQCHINNFTLLLCSTLAVTIVLSLLSYHLVEKKFIDLGKKLSLKVIN